MKKMLLCFAAVQIISLYSAEPKRKPQREDVPTAAPSQTSTIQYTTGSFTPNLNKLAETRESIIKHRTDLIAKEKNPKKISQAQESLLTSMMSNVEYSQALLDLALQKTGLSDKKKTMKRASAHDAITEELTQRYRSLRNQYNQLDTKEIIELQNKLFDDMAAHAKKLLELAGTYISKLKK
ncbi:MAG: hypothetical protein M1114_01065 [Candidatus Dependentiae bacterium]|nr:hypothetical protein [Candidatus Dependentiae bacterium]